MLWLPGGMPAWMDFVWRANRPLMCAKCGRFLQMGRNWLRLGGAGPVTGLSEHASPSRRMSSSAATMASALVPVFHEHTTEGLPSQSRQAPLGKCFAPGNPPLLQVASRYVCTSAVTRHVHRCPAARHTHRPPSVSPGGGFAFSATPTSSSYANRPPSAFQRNLTQFSRFQVTPIGLPSTSAVT